jgi:hypothetical protein
LFLVGFVFASFLLVIGTSADDEEERSEDESVKELTGVG